MKTINLFSKEIPYKDYDCSCDDITYCTRVPVFNLYIQATNNCNGRCLFCDKSQCTPEKEQFNSDGLYSVIATLHKERVLGAISITGGEPLLDTKRLDSILDVIFQVRPDANVSVNSNAYNLVKFLELKHFDRLSEIHISRHHHDDTRNQSIFGLRVASLEEIATFSQGCKPQIVFNCVLQRDAIDSPDKVIEYLEETSSRTGVKHVRFITMMPLTEQYGDSWVNGESLISGLNQFVNAGYLYDKDICNCYSFVYVSNAGVPVTVFVRNTKKIISPYLRQFVYTPDGSLLNGFGGVKIL